MDSKSLPLFLKGMASLRTSGPLADTSSSLLESLPERLYVTAPPSSSIARVRRVVQHVHSSTTRGQGDSHCCVDFHGVGVSPSIPCVTPEADKGQRNQRSDHCSSGTISQPHPPKRDLPLTSRTDFSSWLRTNWGPESCSGDLQLPRSAERPWHSSSRNGQAQPSLSALLQRQCPAHLEPLRRSCV